KIRQRAIDDPADIGDLVDQDAAAATAAAVDIGLSVHGVVIDAQRSPVVFGAKIEATHPVVEIAWAGGRLVDGGPSRRPNPRYPIGEPRDNAARGAWHGALVADECPGFVLAATRPVGVPDDSIERKLRVGRETIVRLQADAP